MVGHFVVLVLFILANNSCPIILSSKKEHNAKQGACWWEKQEYQQGTRHREASRSWKMDEPYDVNKHAQTERYAKATC
jgi:hypothetical protein